VKVSLGSNHSLALTNKGCVYSTGSATFGQLGHANFDMLPSFTKIETHLEDQEEMTDGTKMTSGLIPEFIVDIFAGGNHSWALNNKDLFQKRYPLSVSSEERGSFL